MQHREKKEKKTINIKIDKHEKKTKVNQFSTLEHYNDNVHAI